MNIDRISLEQKFLSLLRRRNYANAVELAYASGCRVDISISFGTSKKKSGVPDSEVRELELIFTQTPIILRDVSPETLSQLRLIAGLYFLFADNKALNTIHFGKDYVPGTKILPEWAPRALENYANYLNSLINYKASKNKNLLLAIRNVRDEKVCDVCKSLHGINYEIDKVPELPYPKCTCELGCRCYLHPVII